MAPVVPKEGLRAPLFFALGCLAIGEPAAAQSVSRQDLQRCSQLPTTELKLACFEALADSSSELAVVPSPEPAASASAEPPMLPQADAAVAPSTSSQETPASALTELAPAASASTVVAAGRSGSATARPDPESAASASPMGPPPGAPQAASMAAMAGARGVADTPAEQRVEKPAGQDRPEDQALVLTVNKVVRGDGRRLIFYFDNGEVWRQRNKDYLTYPKNEPFEVEITKGMMGDYRLRVGGEGRMSRIVRVR